MAGFAVATSSLSVLAEASEYNTSYPETKLLTHPNKHSFLLQLTRARPERGETRKTREKSSTSTVHFSPLVSLTYTILVSVNSTLLPFLRFSWVSFVFIKNCGEHEAVSFNPNFKQSMRTTAFDPEPTPISDRRWWSRSFLQRMLRTILVADGASHTQ